MEFKEKFLYLYKKICKIYYVTIVMENWKYFVFLLGK